MIPTLLQWGFPGSTSGKERACQCRTHMRHGFDLWVGEIPWSRKEQLILVFSPVQFSSVQFSHSVVSTLCDPMNCSTPGLPVHHQFLESTQTHVNRLSDAIQPSHLLSSPSPLALNLSQHQGLFKWVSSSHQAEWTNSWIFESYLRLLKSNLDL